MIRKLLLSILASVAVATGAQAQTILTQFTFETNPATTGAVAAGTAFTPFTAETGTATGTAFHAAASTYSTPVGNGSARSFSSNGWTVGDYYQFSLSTAGSTGIYVQFGALSSNTGPANFALTYSTDGTNFSSLTSNTYAVTATPAFGSATFQAGDVKSFDLTGITALNNATNVTFRLVDTTTVAANGTTVAATGTSRVDDFTVSTGGFTLPVPEPSTYALAAGGLVLLAATQRLRRRNA